MYEKIIFAYEEIELKYYAAQSIWLAWKYYRDNLRGNRKQKKILNKRKHVKVLNTFISSLNSFVELKILINE